MSLKTICFQPRVQKFVKTFKTYPITVLNLSKQAKDELQQTTVFTPHEDDNNRECKQEDNTASVEEIVDMLQQIDDYGVRDVDPNMRRLSIIGERHNIVQQDVPTTNHIIPNITDIPEGFDLTKNSEILNNDSYETSDQESNKLSNVSSKMNCPMIIDILNDTILNNLESNCTDFNNTSTKTQIEVKNLSFQSIIAEYTLDFKQSVAFEIMASSFLLKSMKLEKITEEEISVFFEENDEIRLKYTNCLSEIKKFLKDKGAMEKLIMFLSGMGGTG